MSANGWIGVDLDGTLAHYDGWKGADHIGTPISEMVERVKSWRESGHDVRIFTARYATGTVNERQRVREMIEQWCAEHIGEKLPVTNTKDYGMVELWDDRAVTVEFNTGRPLAPSRHGFS